jgi:predicted ATPase
MTFKETGLKNRFPARLISDGTIYVLCIMTAILSRSRQKGLTIIEEPERGIHPQGITQLVELMRSRSSLEHPVMITTHSESVVRASHENELWLVNKTGGKTQVKNAGRSAIPLQNINLDKAWLMNFFDGGLPW